LQQLPSFGVPRVVVVDRVALQRITNEIN